VLVRQQFIQSIEPLGPELAVESQPAMHLLERPRVKAADVGPAPHLPPDQARAFQCLDMLRCGGQRHLKWLCELTDRFFAARKISQHAPPGRVAKSVKNGIHLHSHIFNHTVKYIFRLRIVNQSVKYNRNEQSCRHRTFFGCVGAVLENGRAGCVEIGYEQLMMFFREDHMKKIAGFATLAFLVATGSALAGEIKFPSDEPVASITFPDGWGEKETDTGIDATAPDESIYLALDVSDPKNTNDTVADTVAWLKGLGVTVDANSSKESKGKLNGMDAVNVDWDGTDKDGPVSISLAAIAVNPNKVLVVTYWGTKGEQEKNAEAMNAIINSLKPAE
jgi:hypothetical protein